MQGDLEAALDALDLAVARGHELTGSTDLDRYARVARDARKRIAFLGETVLVALVGGTGSGKSSLLNALAGEPVAPVGPLRPTTDRPLAWIPAGPEPGIVRLLDDLGIEQRVGQHRYPMLAVLDLPDVDSVVLDHRLTVEALLPRVDAVIWVLDPEKYHDRLLHEDYLGPLAGYEAQFVFVLNQVDRLAPPERAEVVADLSMALVDDGFEAPVLFSVAADPPGGGPTGLGPLEAFLAERMEAKRVVIGKLVEDLQAAGRGIGEATGVGEGKALGYDRRWGEARLEAVGHLAELVAGEGVVSAGRTAGVRLAAQRGSGPLGRAASALRRSPIGRALGAVPGEHAIGRAGRRWSTRSGLEAALAPFNGLVTDLSFETGGEFGAKLRHEFSREQIELGVRTATEGAVAAVGDPPAPQPARWWAVAGVVQLVLLLAAAGAGAWAWAEPQALARGRWPWPLIVAGGAVLVGVALARLVRRSGRKAGARAAALYGAEVAAAIAERLDRRIGDPLRARIRSRAELAGALTELGLITARVEASAR